MGWRITQNCDVLTINEVCFCSDHLKPLLNWPIETSSYSLFWRKWGVTPTLNIQKTVSERDSLRLPFSNQVSVWDSRLFFEMWIWVRSMKNECWLNTRVWILKTWIYICLLYASLSLKLAFIFQKCASWSRTRILFRKTQFLTWDSHFNLKTLVFHNFHVNSGLFEKSLYIFLIIQ